MCTHCKYESKCVVVHVGLAAVGLAAVFNAGGYDLKLLLFTSCTNYQLSTTLHAFTL